MSQENKIDITDFTWHSELYCRNKILKREEVSFAKLNLDPLVIFRIFKEEAKRFNIIMVPSLEVATLININGKKEIVHIILMHENENVIFNCELLFKRFVAFDYFFKKIPNGSIIILPHPWRFGCGLTKHAGVRFTNKLINKKNILVEYNGWFYSLFHCIDTFIKTLYFSKNINLFRELYLNSRRGLFLKGIKGHKSFYGLDCHATHLLPGNTGYVEFESKKELSVKKVLRLVNSGKGNPIMPNKISFFRGFAWLLRDFFAYLEIEFILTYRLHRKMLNKLL